MTAAIRPFSLQTGIIEFCATKCSEVIYILVSDIVTNFQQSGFLKDNAAYKCMRPGAEAGRAFYLHISDKKLALKTALQVALSITFENIFRNADLSQEDKNVNQRTMTESCMKIATPAIDASSL